MTTPDAPAGADPRRAVPRTDAVLADPRLAAAAERLGRDLVKAAVGEAQRRARAGLVAPEEVADTASRLLPTSATTLRPVLNATGVVLHTNLGRAALSAAATEAMALAAGTVDVEFDLVSGQRARRGRGALEALAAALPGAEDVHVVGNGAAALLLAVTALAGPRGTVVVSRGEMVEIGDGFRLPDLMQSTGVAIREVGTTNRTVLADYAAAVAPGDVGAVVKIHPSNFTVAGFTAAVGVRDLAGLGVPLVVDVGSGLLAPDPLLPDEPSLAAALADGATVVTASGDKLLGGPQSGLVAGRREAVQRLRRHPLARALRCDKTTLAALEATLRGPATPTAVALHADPDALRRRAEALASSVGGEVVASTGVVGGGGAPGVVLPGWAVALPERLAAPLRTGDPAVVGRVERGRLLLDLRCVPPDRDGDVAAAVRAARG